MALNLWKVGGKSTSFNPLPTTFTYGTSLNSLNLPPAINNPNSNAVLSFWAYSPSSGIVHLNSTNVAKDFNLTPTRSFFSYILSSPSPFNHIDLYDKNSNGDIIIDSISVVQAPLQKNTINGVDGFLSGKWGYGGASATPATLNIVDDTTATLVSTDTSWKNAYIIVPVQPNTTYTFSGQFSSNFTTAIALRIDSVATATSSGGGSIIYNGTVYFNSPSCTFTTPNNSNGFIMIYFQTHYVENLTWKNIILNVGSLPAPYEPKHGDKMVMPIVNGNMLPSFKSGAWNLSTNISILSDSKIQLNATAQYQEANITIPVKPNTAYYISGVSSDPSYKIFPKNFDSSYQYPAGLNYSITTRPQDNILKFVISNANVGTFTMDSIQLKQGTAPTSLSPYVVQSNKLPSKLIPDNKNLLPDFDNWILSGSAKVINGELNFYSYSDSATTDFIPLNNTTGITASFEHYSDMVAPTTSANPDGTKSARLLNVSYFDINKNPVNSSGGVLANGSALGFSVGSWLARSSSSISWSTGSQVKYIKVSLSSSATWTPTAYKTRNPMVTLDSSTDYIAYKLNNQKANIGLSFNSVSDYIDLGTTIKPINSLSIESYFRINSPFSGVEKALIRKDACFELGFYNNSTNYYIRNLVKTSSISGWTAINDIPFALVIGQWYKIKMIFNNDGNIYTYLNDTLIATKPATGSYIDTPASVTRIASGVSVPSPLLNCDIQYVNFVVDGVSFNYDFTSPCNITGTTVLTSGNMNLIPSFDDSGWVGPNSFTILGEDVLSLNTQTLWNEFYHIINVTPNTNYMATTGNPNPNMRLYIKSFDGSSSIGSSVLSPFTFNSGSATQLRVVFTNPVTGNLYLIRPQLYQLTGQEGTINGAPRQLNKQTKRTLYTKR